MFGSVDTSDAQTKVTVKKSNSGRKKGALIGAGAGALGGVLVSKNNTKGALIGGATGAGAGYLIGRRSDNKKPVRKVKYKTETIRYVPQAR
ncbi:MAG: glycine zipper 2TM domain-containing protein [Sphingobacteriales bacterium]|nr:MAG: glycine zipper 2TM domain-containing protein [Sphingobacteriales bacterium]